MIREISFRRKSSHKCEAVRRKNIAKGVTLNLCCPKGFYLHKVKRCEVPLMIQSVNFNGDIFNIEDAE